MTSKAERRELARLAPERDLMDLDMDDDITNKSLEGSNMILRMQNNIYMLWNV